MPDSTDKAAASLSDLPEDQLLAYGLELGLDLEPAAPRPELVRRIQQRQELLAGIDQEALLDVAAWARRPVRRSAGKEELAKEIAQIQASSFRGLSDRGLRALAALRDVPHAPDESRSALEKRLRSATGWRARARRMRRQVLGRVISQVVKAESPDDYVFLPENQAAGGDTLRRDIETEGVVGGIARKLRGVADDYVREKLDEIEQRIDTKLDDIENRLAEWRDQEIRNRLRIIKLTLLASVIVALLSLGYDLVQKQWLGGPEPSQADQRAPLDDPKNAPPKAPSE